MVIEGKERLERVLDDENESIRLGFLGVTLTAKPFWDSPWNEALSPI